MNKNRKSLVDAMSSTQKNKPIQSNKDTQASTEMKQIIVRVSEEAHYQLKKLALEERSQIQSLATEALNDLFKKYKVPPIA